MFHERSDLNFKVYSNWLTLLWTTCSSIKDFKGKENSHSLVLYTSFDKAKYTRILCLSILLGEIWVQNLAKTKPKGKWK